MKKSELRASKDSQGYYEVRHCGRIVWDGYADNANQAKDYAVENSEEESGGMRWDDANCEWVAA